jgi:Family of unknown function (DUF6185)
VTTHDPDTPEESPQQDANNEPLQESASNGLKNKRASTTHWRKAIVFCVALAAAALGHVHAESQQATQSSTAKPPPCAPLVKSNATEKLVIHSKAPPFTSTLTETVTVPTDNQYAQTLTSGPNIKKAEKATACLFTNAVPYGPISGTPVLISVAHGRDTFRISQSLSTLPTGNEWQIYVHPHIIRVEYTVRYVCKSSHVAGANWGGTTVNVVMVADTATNSVTPPPSSYENQTYSWHSPAGSCNKLPSISISIPISLLGYVSGVINKPRSTWIPLIEVLGWLDPVIITLIALYLIVRSRRVNSKSPVVFLLAFVAALSIVPAVVHFNGFNYYLLAPSNPLAPAKLIAVFNLQAPAELIAVFVVCLSLTLSLQSAVRPGAENYSKRRIVTSLVISLTGGAAVFFGALRYHVWFDGAIVLLFVIVAVLLSFVGIIMCSIAHMVPIKDDNEIRVAAWLKAGAFQTMAIFLIGGVLFITFAYALGDVSTTASFQSAIASEYDFLRYPLAAFATVLIEVALLIPLICSGASADDKIIAGATFGFSIATQQPDLSIADFHVPVGTVIFAYVTYVLIKRNKSPECDKSSISSSLKTCMPYIEPLDNAILAIKVAAVLAVVPVGYFVYTVVTNLPSELQKPAGEMFFIATNVIGQLAAWIVVGVFLALLSTRLPGRVGPLRVLILSAIWFIVAIVNNIVESWFQHSDSRSWVFPGLQLLLFMLAFSVAWDACMLRRRTWMKTIDDLRLGYNIQKTRSVVLYAIAVLAAIVAIGQQVASGGGAEFVKSALAGAAAVFGG